MNYAVILTECIIRGMDCFSMSTTSHNYDRFLINSWFTTVSAIFQQKYHDIFSGKRVCDCCLMPTQQLF